MKWPADTGGWGPSISSVPAIPERSQSQEEGARARRPEEGYLILAAVLLFFGCAAPDRWHVTGGKTYGDFDSEKALGFESDESTLEVGVSGDLPWAPKQIHPAGSDPGLAQDIRLLRAEIERLETAAIPDSLFDNDLVLAAIGLLVSGGGVYGYRKYTSRRK